MPNRCNAACASYEKYRRLRKERAGYKYKSKEGKRLSRKNQLKPPANAEELTSAAVVEQHFEADGCIPRQPSEFQ